MLMMEDIVLLMGFMRQGGKENFIIKSQKGGSRE